MSHESRDSPARVVRSVTPQDAAAIASIYNYHVINTIVTFEEAVIGATEMAQRIGATTADYPWLVFELDSSLVGYAYASKWQLRSSYRHTVETTIYVHHESTGRRIGTELYEALIALLRQQEFHCAVGGVSLPNPASIALHEHCGFHQAAEFKQVGRKFGRWIDVGYWTLIL